MGYFNVNQRTTWANFNSFNSHVSLPEGKCHREATKITGGSLYIQMLDNPMSKEDINYIHVDVR